MDKRKQEMQTVYEMIRLYCRSKHHSKELCETCNELYSYAQKRIENCPMIETKTFCSQCKIHCYKVDMREQIRKVMRYSGPRMLFVHPIMAISHLYYQMKDSRK